MTNNIAQRESLGKKPDHPSLAEGEQQIERDLFDAFSVGIIT
jgi:hypothetical protein